MKTRTYSFTDQQIDTLARHSNETGLSKAEIVRRAVDSYFRSFFWEELSDAEKEGISQGLEDVKAGRVTPHEQVRKNDEQWL
jgi:predicted transcriptional regulator